MSVFKNTNTRPDGTSEVLIPHRTDEGHYLVSRHPADGASPNTHQRGVPTYPELLLLARTGEYCINFETAEGSNVLLPPTAYAVVQRRKSLDRLRSLSAHIDHLRDANA